MATPVTVTQDRLIAASADAVWSIISDPAMKPRLDPRCTLESTTGTAGARGSSYVLTIKAPRVTVNVEYTIVESEQGSVIVEDVARKGKSIGQARGEILPAGGSVRLRWSFTGSAARLWRRAYAARSERQVTLWLDAVEREARSA